MYVRACMREYTIYVCMRVCVRLGVYVCTCVFACAVCACACVCVRV